MSNQWHAVKADTQSKHEKIMNYINNGLPTDITTLKVKLTSYIKKGGVSQNPATDADYNDVVSLYTKLNGKKTEYKQLHSELSSKIKEISTAGDMGRILLENGNLQSQVSSLEVKVKESEDDVKSAELRDELLRSQDRNITKHQVFMLGRPLRPNTIPYLWALSILLIGVSLLVFQTQGPSLMEPLFIWLSASSASTGYFMDSRVWMILAGALAIVILFLSLRVANVI